MVGGQQRLEEGPVFRLGVAAQQSQGFTVNPAAHVAVCQHRRAGIHEYRIRTDVVHVVVRIDHEPHRRRCEAANGRKNLLSRVGAEESVGIDVDGRVDDGNPGVADDEPRVRHGWGAGLWIRNRSPDVRTDFLQCERRLTGILEARDAGYAEQDDVRREGDEPAGFHRALGRFRRVRGRESGVPDRT
jgi:hypothetical protein